MLISNKLHSFRNFTMQKYNFIIKPTRFCGKNQNIMISFSFGLLISSYFVKNHIEMSKIYKFLSTFIIFSYLCSSNRKKASLVLEVGLQDDWRRSQ